MHAAGNLNLGIYSPVRDTCVDYSTKYFTCSWCCWKERICIILWFPVGVEKNYSLRLDFCPSSLGKNHKARCGAHRSLLKAPVSSAGSDWEGGLSEMWCVTWALIKCCSSLSCDWPCAGGVCTWIYPFPGAVVPESSCQQLWNTCLPIPYPHRVVFLSPCAFA